MVCRNRIRIGEVNSSVFSRELKAAEESASGREVRLRDERSMTNCIAKCFGVHSKELVQRRLRNRC